MADNSVTTGTNEDGLKYWETSVTNFKSVFKIMGQMDVKGGHVNFFYISPRKTLSLKTVKIEDGVNLEQVVLFNIHYFTYQFLFSNAPTQEVRRWLKTHGGE